MSLFGTDYELYSQPDQFLVARAASENCLYPYMLNHYCSLFINFNSYTMGTSGLPDIYTQSPKAAGPSAESVYIRQPLSAHGITTM